MADNEAALPDSGSIAAATRRTESWRERVRWFAAEFLVVVTGVLVALALNAWWEGRQEIRREEDYLTQLRSDLRINQQRLLEAMRLEETTRQSAGAVMAAIGDATPISADSAHAWMIERRASFYSDPRLLLGTVSALMETGDINLVRDSEIRQQIIEYQSQIEADRAEFGRWVDRLAEYLQDFYSRAVGNERWQQTNTSLPHQVRAITAGQNDRGMLNPLFGMYWTSGIRLTYLQRMLEATTALSGALGASGVPD